MGARGWEERRREKEKKGREGSSHVAGRPLDRHCTATNEGSCAAVARTHASPGARARMGGGARRKSGRRPPPPPPSGIAFASANARRHMAWRAPNDEQVAKFATGEREQTHGTARTTSHGTQHTNTFHVRGAAGLPVPQPAAERGAVELDYCRVRLVRARHRHAHDVREHHQPVAPRALQPAVEVFPAQRKDALARHASTRQSWNAQRGVAVPAARFRQDAPQDACPAEQRPCVLGGRKLRECCNFAAGGSAEPRKVHHTLECEIAGPRSQRRGCVSDQAAGAFEAARARAH